MVSLSVGHYGALRNMYNDMKAVGSYGGVVSHPISAASDTKYQIHTPWIVRAGGSAYDLRSEDRLSSQFALPMMRRDVHKNHKYHLGWETNIYDPLDQRTKNVPSKPKAVSSIPCPAASQVEETYVKAPVIPDPISDIYLSRNPPGKYGTAMRLQSPPFASSASTRSEEWSTLRQMMPSRGPVVTKRAPENWGTGTGYLPEFAPSATQITTSAAQMEKTFPRINSSMSRYAHDSYFHDRMFKMF